MADNNHDNQEEQVTLASEAKEQENASIDDSKLQDEAVDQEQSSDYQESTVDNSSPSVKLEDELKQSFIDYAMSVIVDRALPDVRDGLKPVHRRVLFDMYDLKIWHNGPTKKSARVVGDVIGRFHPHGDAAVYDTIVRMAQWWSMRAPLVFGQGNFGNLDGDGAAAMRYTEVRMTKIAEMMLQDIDKETVNTYPNYDGNEQIPEVLPTRFPNLLVNGSSGIAVGMATNIPPHNLAEVIDGTLAMLENPDITLDELMEYIPGPDFPTGGLILKAPEIRKAYATGHGRCTIRARTHVEKDKQGRATLYVDEIPYMINKSTIVREIANLLREKKIEGITDVSDLSDKDNQVRIAIDLKRDAYEEAVLSNLFKHTSMQSYFNINVIALVNNRPKLLPLIEILKEFIKFRREVVTRRTVFLLRQDRRKAFLDEGLIVAKSNIQQIIDIVTNADNSEDARIKLMTQSWDGTLISSIIEYDDRGVNICLPIGIEADRGLIDGKYHLSDAQARAILALQLNRLTHLATEEILKDYKALQQNIHDYLEILNNTERMNSVIKEELLEARNTFKDPRRSRFTVFEGSISRSDLISRQPVLITLSNEGYIKYQDLSLFEAYSRGAAGNSAAKLKDEDFIVTTSVCNSHDMVLCFTNKGRCFAIRVYDLPNSANKTWRGRPVQNFFNLNEGESVRCILPVSDELLDKLNNQDNSDEVIYIVFATAKAGIKRTPFKQFKNLCSRCSNNGILAITIKEGDELIAVDFTHGDDDIILVTNEGRATRFCEEVWGGNEQDDSDSELDLDDEQGDNTLDENVDDQEDDQEDDDSNDDEPSVEQETKQFIAERDKFRQYLANRKSSKERGIVVKSRTASTLIGMRLLPNTTLASMIVVPANQLEDEKQCLLFVTESGVGKRMSLVQIAGTDKRGKTGMHTSRKSARSERVVGVVKVHQDSDYLVFSNTGSVMRSRASDVNIYSRISGYFKIKRIQEGEVIVGIQAIAPEIAVELNEAARARMLERRRAAGIDENNINPNEPTEMPENEASNDDESSLNQEQDLALEQADAQDDDSSQI